MRIEIIFHASVFNKLCPSSRDAPDVLCTTKSPLCGTQTHHLSSSSLFSILSLLLPEQVTPPLFKEIFQIFYNTHQSSGGYEAVTLCSCPQQRLACFFFFNNLTGRCLWLMRSVIAVAQPLQVTHEGLWRSSVSSFPWTLVFKFRQIWVTVSLRSPHLLFTAVKDLSIHEFIYTSNTKKATYIFYFNM